MRSTTCLRTKSRKFLKNIIVVVFVKTYFYPISLYARRRFFIWFPLSPKAELNKYLPKYRSVCVPTQYTFRVKRTMHIVILLRTYVFFYSIFPPLTNYRFVVACLIIFNYRSNDHVAPPTRKIRNRARCGCNIYSTCVRRTFLYVN